MPLTELLRNDRLIRLCQIAIGLIFAVAGMAKLGDLGAFAEQIHNFRIAPAATENLLALSLPGIEVVAALALVLNIRARSGAVVVTGLMAVFTVAVLAALARGLDIECGCFGTADASRVGLIKVGQNVVMLLVAAVGTVRPH